MKRIFSILTTLALTCGAMSALTHIPEAQPDFNGDYVYYQDKTFSRDTYIGFLYYDDSTYGVRYYAQADAKNALPEKDITVLFTTNPSADHLELTGERIVERITQEDVDTINYIHDMFYELYARRQKVTSLSSAQTFTSELNEDWQDFPQFGGTVVMRFNKIIPIFNLYSIETVEGSVLLQTATIGSLTSSEDSSFADFKGFAKSSAKGKAKKVRKGKNPQTYTYQFDINPAIAQSITLDSEWMRSYDNVFTFAQAQDTGITLSFHPLDAEVSRYIADAFLRNLLQSKNGAYTDFSTLRFTHTEKSNFFKLEFEQVYPQQNIRYQQTSLVTQINDATFACMSFHAESMFYQTNRAYFNDIIKSYSY